MSGGFDGIYARVAIILDSDGQSGLFITQGEIQSDGTVILPVFRVPGLTVKGISVVLVPTLDDIASATPTVIAMDHRTL